MSAVTADPNVAPAGITGGSVVSAGGNDTTPPASGGNNATPPAAGGNEAAAELIDLGEDGKAVTSKLHDGIRELQRINKAIESRKAELAGLDGKPPVKSGVDPASLTEDEEGLVEAFGGRVPKKLAEQFVAMENALGQAMTRLDELQSGDLTKSAEQTAKEIEGSLRTLVHKATDKAIPGLEGTAGQRVKNNAWSDFEGLWNEYLQGRPADAGPITEQEIVSMVSRAVVSVRNDLGVLGWKQVGKAAEAGRLQGPALSGLPGETAGKKYIELTPEERRQAEAQANLTGGAVKFDTR